MLLSIPREVRVPIYEFYITEHDGYCYNYVSGKLRPRKGRIDLALMYTCTTINAEMHGLALKMNTVTFSTAYSNSERRRASRWDRIMVKLPTPRLRP